MMTSALQMKLVLGLVLLGMVSVTCHAADASAVHAAAVAETFTKTAQRVYSTDWVDFDYPIAKAFSDEEMAILADHLSSLQSMIYTALGLQDSVWGAKLAGHFGISETLPRLRHHFLTPRRCYGWEGPDYSKLESYLADHQFQYSVAYLEAIEAITEEDIAEAILLTESEVAEIQRLAGLEKSQHYHWALWMQRKLKIPAGPNPSIELDTE